MKEYLHRQQRVKILFAISKGSVSFKYKIYNKNIV